MHAYLHACVPVRVYMHTNTHAHTHTHTHTQESVMSLVCGALMFEMPASIFFFIVRNR